ncbi:integral membrane regulatory protein, partial [Streptomyces coelicoflavus ZG0656]
PEPPAAPPVPVPQQQAYGTWDTTTGYPGAEYGSYDGGYGGEQYQGAQQYDPGAYAQQPYQADPYQQDAYQGGPGGQAAQYGTGGQYDPYAYGDPAQGQEAGYDPAFDQAYGQGGYDTPYDPSQPRQPHGTGSERPDGSQQ